MKPSNGTTPEENGSENGGKRDFRSTIANMTRRQRILAIIIGTFLMWQLGSFTTDTEPTLFSYTEFISQAADGNVEAIEINNSNGSITGTLEDGAEFTTTGGGERGLSIDDERVLRENEVEIVFNDGGASPLMGIIGMLLPIFLIGGLLFWFMRRQTGAHSSMMQVGKSNAKEYNSDRPTTLFSDIAGYEGVKQEITEVVDFLQNPEKFESIGARVPKGVLLVGPPGTGKTQIARAVAGEAGVGFLAVSGSDFMEMFVGVGASRVRDLFEKARSMGKAIIFIDEIDSIGRKRGTGMGGGNDEREQTLNQMLAEMDGFENSSGVVVLAATNRPEMLDAALLRPGRFDRQVVVPLPEVSERKAILEVHARDKMIGETVDLAVMAKATPGMSGADLANLVNEAALIAVRRDSITIESEDFENARDRIVLGALRTTTVMSAEEKRITAYHEAGHALLATILAAGDPLHKVTILPRGMALGVAWSLPTNRVTYSKQYLEDTIAKALGGRAAELLVFNHQSSGASNDIEQATDLARRMVSQFGMSDAVGPMQCSAQSTGFLGSDGSQAKEIAEKTAELVDSEVLRILREQEQRAYDELLKHRRGLELVSEALIEEETLDAERVAALIMQGVDESGISEEIELNIATFDF